jgi:hypothetical protein
VASAAASPVWGIREAEGFERGDGRDALLVDGAHGNLPQVPLGVTALGRGQGVVVVIHWAM